MKKQSSSGKSTRNILLFSLLTLAIIVLSLIVKILLLFSQSTFDSTHQFVLAVRELPSSAVFLVFAPDKNNITDVTFDGGNKNIDFRSEFSIPEDAEVIMQKGNVVNTPQTILTHLLFHLSSYPHYHINLADVFRMYLFTQSIQQNALYYKQVAINSPIKEKDGVIQFAFTDHLLYQQEMSIGILNAADVPGLGTRMAKLIQNIGGNIISVSSADTPVKNSNISYSGKKPSYTAIRLSKIFGYPLVKMQNAAISDIIITLGTNYSSYPGF